MESKRKILIFAPHSDDEILGVGGTISKCSKRGDDVYVCIVTCAEEESYKIEIQQEAKKANSYLGVKKLLFLDFPTCKLKDLSLAELNSKICNVVNEIKPNLVFIPHFGDMHIDHRIVADSVMVAVRPIGQNIISGVYSYETLSETEYNVQTPSNMFCPDFYVDISDVIQNKIEAMKFYKTQIKEFPSPRSLKAIEALSEYRGSSIGAKNAEAFHVIREINKL